MFKTASRVGRYWHLSQLERHIEQPLMADITCQYLYNPNPLLVLHTHLSCPDCHVILPPLWQMSDLKNLGDAFP
jgi:hypothetical protein